MVSIILVNYNGAKDTIECIQSICKTEGEEYRIIVVDNCSTDDSVLKLEAVKQKYSFELIRSEINNGFSAGNNIGIKRAMEKGTDYIWLLNNDTLVLPNTMTELKSCFKNNTKCGVSIAKILYERERNRIWYAGGAFNNTTARTEHWHFNENNEKLLDEVRKVSFATGCCFFMSKKACERIGYMDEDFFLYEEDVDYSIRTNQVGYDIIYNPYAIIFHKVSASTGAASPLSQYYCIRNRYMLIRKHFKGMNKIQAYCYCSIQALYRCIKRELSFQYFVKGLFAHIKHEIGPRKKKI